MRAPFALVLAGAPLVAGCHSASTPPTPPDAGASADVQLLSMTTWLGQLDPVAGVAATDGGATPEYGGLAALSSYFAADRAKNPSTALLLSADSFGASPPLSATLHDVPAVKALGFLGAKVDMLSNHNFNKGLGYLQNLVGLSSYPYVASNLNGVQAAVSSSVTVPYVLLSVGPVKIGVLGLTDTNAPNKTVPGAFGPISIDEPVPSANAAAQQARAAGAQAVVALTDLSTTGVGIAGVHTGPLIDFATAVSGVDVVIGSIASDPVAQQAGQALVVEHVWKGQTYGRTTLHFEAGALASVHADIVVADANAVTPDPAAVQFLAPYRTQLAQLFDGKIGVAEATYPLDGTERVAETAIGDLVAEAFLEQYKSFGAQIAIENGAGIRDALPSTYTPADKTLRRTAPGYAAGPPYDLVAGDAYSVLPFGNTCVMRPVTGATLWAALEQSVFQEPGTNNGFLQIAGFKFSYRPSAAAGARVQSVTLDDGTVITRNDPTTYMLVDTNFVDGGGDGYNVLVQTPAAPQRDVDAEVLLAYLRAHPDVTPAVAGRITQVP